MVIRIKNAVGTVMLLSGLPVIAQNTAALKATVPANCASCPQTSGIVVPPGDPTFLIAGAFILGAIVGFAVARVMGNKKQ